MTKQGGRAVQKQELPKRCASRCAILLIMHLTCSLNDWQGLAGFALRKPLRMTNLELVLGG